MKALNHQNIQEHYTLHKVDPFCVYKLQEALI